MRCDPLQKDERQQKENGKSNNTQPPLLLSKLTSWMKIKRVCIKKIYNLLVDKYGKP